MESENLSNYKDAFTAQLWLFTQISAVSVQNEAHGIIDQPNAFRSHLSRLTEAKIHQNFPTFI